MQEARPQLTPGQKMPTNLSPQAYAHRLHALAALSIAWSPAFCATATATDDTSPPASDSCQHQRHALLALGTKAGIVWLWRYSLPCSYSPAANTDLTSWRLLGGFRAHASHITALALQSVPATDAQANLCCDRGGQPKQVMLVTGCSDGSVRLHVQDTKHLAQCKGISEGGPSLSPDLFLPARLVQPADLYGVTCLALKHAPAGDAGKACTPCFVGHLTTLWSIEDTSSTPASCCLLRSNCCGDTVSARGALLESCCLQSTTV